MAAKKERPAYTADLLGLDVLSGDDDIFRWFLACFLFGKPIQASVALNTWQLFIDRKIDTPWAIRDMNRRRLVRLLDEGNYTRYDESTARGLQKCMEQLIDWYEGSLNLMIELCENEEQLSKRLQKFYGIGPKTAEIFMRETTEYFARRIE